MAQPVSNQLRTSGSYANKPLDERYSVNRYYASDDDAENSIKSIQNMSGAYIGLHVYVTDLEKNETDKRGEYVITKLTSDNDVDMSGVKTLQEYVGEQDPQVYEWAKQPTKPSYTANEVGAVPDTRKVNNKYLSSDIQLTPSDIGAQPTIDSSHKLSADNIADGSTNKVVTETEKTTWNGKQEALSSTQLTNINKGGTALQPSSTSGLLKNDGTVDTETQNKAANAIQTPSANNAGKIPVMTDNGIIWETKPDATNPFKGWFEDAQDLPTSLDPVSPVVGDYAYVDVVDETDPQNPVTTTYVYRCVTEGEWPSSSSETTNPSNNPSFRSGETIHNIPIDNSRLANPSTKALAKAIDVVAKIQPLDFAINGNPGTPTEQEIDYSGPDNEYFKAAKRKLVPANGRIYYSSNYTYDTVYYYQVNNGDVLNIHIPKLGTTNNSATILGFSTREYPNMSDLTPVAPIVKFDKNVSDYGSNYADNEGQGYDIENYTVEVPNVSAGTPVWLVICAYGVVTDYTIYDTNYIPTVNRVITTGQETGLLERVEALENGAPAVGDGILDLNPEKEIVEKLKAARYTNTTNSTAITFAHISDVHGNTTKFERFLEFASRYKDLGYIADAVDTGDLTDTIIKDRAQFANYNSETNWYDPTEDLITAYNAMHDEFKALDETERVLGFKNVLLINGNHDTDCGLTYNDGTDTWAAGRWLYFVGKPVYDREFKAHAEPESGTTDPWGVTFPSGAGSNDYYPCYYHKDYNNGIRAVFVDVMDWGITQQTWLNDVLAAALSSSKHVIIFTHYLNDRKVYAQCSYNGIGDSEGGDADLGTENNNMSFYGEMTCVYQRPANKYNAIHANPPILKTIAANVQDFIDNGGIFVGYIGGHRHYNAIGYLKLYPKQWFALITSANTATKGHDYPNSGRAVDNFQLVTVNPYKKTLILTKIGGQYNNNGAHTETLGINYVKHCIVSEGYGVMPKENKGASSNRPTLTIGDAGFEYFDTTLGKPIYWNGSTWIDGNGTNVDNE